MPDKAAQNSDSTQRFNDGEGERPTGWLYDRFRMCYDKHSCHQVDSRKYLQRAIHRQYRTKGKAEQVDYA
jgi:hypothetical protein